MRVNSEVYIPKEISWLSFNERVLQEADNKEVPLIDRIKFLGIYSNNLDEFFRVRVATLKRLTILDEKSREILGYSASETLKDINSIVLKQRAYYEDIYKRVITDLAKEEIYLLNEVQLNEEQREFAANYFKEELKPILMPIMMQKERLLNDLKDDIVYFAITIYPLKESKKVRYALMELPTDSLPRFIELPFEEGKHCYIFLDDIVRLGIKEIFSLFKFREISAYTIKLTRDAELDIVDDLSESYLDIVSRSLLQRKTGDPVRLLYDREIPEDLLSIITLKLNLGKQDTLLPGSRYHNLKDLIKFPDPGISKFSYEKLIPLRHKDLNPEAGILAAIRKKDILLYFPYHPFEHFIDLLREACLDPSVRSIKITLYRAARNSSVVKALLNAARNGKEVTAIIELQARFDEEANIYWSHKLREEGIKVVYGIQGLKVHAKLCLITRVKNKSIQKYACIGTGNFNEDTAKVYTDHLLMTSDTKITNEVAKTFSFLEKNYKKSNYYHLITAPHDARNRISRLIQNEIANAKIGEKAYIHFKLNNVVDHDMINLLYKADRAGVEVNLIVRGMFSLKTGIKNVSENIKAIGMVDRFLEHTRILIFCNGGDEKYFITSGDLMTRNLERRVEVTCPIFDEELQKQLRTIFDIQWNDNKKARILDSKLRNNYVANTGKEVHSQLDIYEYLKKLNETSLIT